MNYSLTDYQGNQLTITTEQASKIADVSELIEVTVNGQTHYLNPKNIASIKPVIGLDREANRQQLERMSRYVPASLEEAA